MLKKNCDFKKKNYKLIMKITEVKNSADVDDPTGSTPSIWNGLQNDIVFYNEKLMLVEKPDEKAIEAGLLYVPGGKLDKGETPEACARRELYEETGLEVDSMERLSIFYFHHERKKLLYKFYIYLIYPKNGNAEPHDDISKIHWCDLDSLEKDRMFYLTWVQIRLMRLSGLI